MKRLLFDVPRWHLYLHRDARNLPAAFEVDGPLRQLEDELYDVLYAGEGTTLPEGERAPAHLAQWAESLHGAFRALPAFERLARQCRGDADAAAVAVESLLEQLQPKLPAAPSLPEAGTLRRAAARASTEALQAVAEAQEWATALAQVAGVGVGKGAQGNGAGAQSPKDEWATAVALALLHVAQEEKRPFTLLCFSGEVTGEATVRPGEALPQDALFVHCDGGTSIDAALRRALDVIQDGQARMKAADVILVTDGYSDDEEAPALRERARALAATVLGFGIGVAPGRLAPWCDEAQAITSLEVLEPAAAEALSRT